MAGAQTSVMSSAQAGYYARMTKDGNDKRHAHRKLPPTTSSTAIFAGHPEPSTWQPRAATTMRMALARLALIYVDEVARPRGPRSTGPKPRAFATS